MVVSAAPLPHLPPPTVVVVCPPESVFDTIVPFVLMVIVAVAAVLPISAPVEALTVFDQVTDTVCADAGLYCAGIVPIVAPAEHAATRISTFAVTVHALLDKELVFTVLAYANDTELVDVVEVILTLIA